MDLSTITITDFKTRFYQDFNYESADDPNYVSNQDITNAFGESQATLNQGLFGNDTKITLAYLFLTAHNVCNDLRAAGGGINGPGFLPVSSRSVGSVSEAYGIPKSYLDNPLLATYTQTSYGLKYLSLALPNLVGNFAAVWGGAHA